MSNNSDAFLKKSLGEDFFESLAKVELWKPGTRTTIDHEEIKTALKIVPRTVMALLIRELAPMAIGEHKDIELPMAQNAKLKVDKHERDVYSGFVDQDNKNIVDFKFRSLPGIGLVIMSAFELYDVDNLEENKHPDIAEGAEDKVQKLIEEKMAMQNLIHAVIDQKMAHREAVQQLLLMKLTDELKRMKSENHGLKYASAMNHFGDMIEKDEEASIAKAEKKKGSPLKDFLDKRSQKKAPKKEFEVVMAKGETVDCPDCKKNIFDGQLFSGCICLGDDRDKKIYIKKSENGINVRFGRGWDEENIEMLLDVLRKKHG